MSSALATRGWVLGRIGAAPVVVSPTSLLLGLLIAGSWYPLVRSTLAFFGVGAVLVTVAGTVLGVGASILIHELAHGMAGTALGRRPVRYELYLWGGRTSFGPARSWAPWKDVITSLAGPAANLALWAVGRVLLGGGAISSVLVLVAASALTWVNLALAIFNALPGLPLDGGHALAALVTQITGRPQAGQRIAAGGGLLVVGAVAWYWVLDPLLLRGAQFIPDTDYKGHVLHTLIEGQCGLLGAHTNADAAIAGVNEALCDALNLTDRTALAEPQTQELGGEEHLVGTGRVGTLPEPLTLRALSERLADALPATAGGLRIAGRPEQRISRVALCGGAGDSLFEAVRSVGADVYITADLRHHPASEFREQELVRGTECALIDCSHAASESLWLQRAGERLQALLAERGHSITFTVSSLNTDPWDFTVSTGSAAGSASTR